MATATSTKAVRGQINTGQLAMWTLIAGVVAAIANAIVFLIADSQGVFDNLVVPMGAGQPFALINVIVSSIVFIAIGGVVLWVIDRFLSARPVAVWRNVAIVALLLSLLQPFGIENMTAGSWIAIELMHIVAGIIAIAILTTRIDAP